ncbi:MAG TPA: MFS transporter [Candidatus Limnocylindria bacterium]|nr:MFS transporter [Candidatus Limnocylindria bacterium]
MPRDRPVASILPLALFRVGDFRYLGASVVLNSVGMMGEIVVLGWLTLELTNSPFMVGVALGMRMLPLFFVGVPAGAVADRFPRHRLLMLTGAGQALTTATLGGLFLLGTLTLTHVMLLTLASGVFRALEHAARQSYTHDVVGAPALMSGFAILGVAMRLGWLLGSLGIGAVIARYGSGVAYLAVSLGFLAGALALWPAKAPATAREPASLSVWGSTLDFVAALGRDRVLLVLMMLTAGAEILGFAHQALLPSLARDVLRIGPEGLGALAAARSVGGILGLAAAAMTGGAITAGGGKFLAVLLTFGLSLVALGVAPYVVGFAGVVVVLVIVNGAGALADLQAQSLMQLSVPNTLRGRAGGAWVVAIGLAPLGQMQIGALASLFGVGVAFGASGLALTILAVATGLLFPRLRRV